MPAAVTRRHPSGTRVTAAKASGLLAEAQGDEDGACHLFLGCRDVRNARFPIRGGGRGAGVDLYVHQACIVRGFSPEGEEKSGALG